jgi:nucleotide-binding universal stress UspA family protein
VIKTILVPVTGEASDKTAFRTAVVAARLFDAHLEFLVARIDPTAMLIAMAGSDFGAGLAIPDLLTGLEKEEQARVTRARRFFEEFCAQEKAEVVDHAPTGGQRISAAWREQKGNEAEVVAQRARFSDLVVVRPAEDEPGVSMQTIEAALMEGGRPILLAPRLQPANLARTVVIAWKDTAEAARAVTAAMPFLSRAEKIVVLTIGETDESNLSSIENVAAYLRWHRFEVDAQCIAPGQEVAPETLLRAARDIKADLIVMGGYGHSRAREIIFGGFTRHVIRGVELPILLCH